jgi:hypothetical protein
MAGFRYHCPVDRCNWFTDETDSEVADNVLRGAFGVEGGLARTVDATEARLEAHLVTHKPLEFVATIARMRNELNRLSPGTIIVGSGGEL